MGTSRWVMMLRLLLVHELDRLLHGDDVAARSCVDVVEQGGQGGRLAGAGRTGDEDQAGAHLAELFDDRGTPSCSRVAILVGMIRKTAAVAAIA
jgi:hypothetical protein